MILYLLLYLLSYKYDNKYKIKLYNNKYKSNGKVVNPHGKWLMHMGSHVHGWLMCMLHWVVFFGGFQFMIAT